MWAYLVIIEVTLVALFFLAGGISTIFLAVVAGILPGVVLTTLTLSERRNLYFDRNPLHTNTSDRALVDFITSTEFTKIMKDFEEIRAIHTSTRGVVDNSYYTHRVFENELIDTDGNLYRDCKFVQCRVIFRGLAPVSFKDCDFTDCDWVFDASAQLTLAYLAALHRGLGDSGRKLVEDLFQRIREDVVTEEGKSVTAVTR
jgi:hypothetical protein